MATTLSSRLTRKLNIEHPIISAPMTFAAGGALASAVSAAGGLGLIGGGYGDSDWLDEQFEIAGGRRRLHHMVAANIAIPAHAGSEASPGGGDVVLRRPASLRG